MFVDSTEIYLRPMDAPPPPGPNRSDAEAEVDKSVKTRVLVVDDESMIRDTLVEILNGCGFEAVGVSSGDAALEILPRFSPDVVVSDVVMPGKNGVEAAIRIRELLPRCRVILISGQAATGDLLREAGEAGHEFEILAKPFRPQVLLGLLRQRQQ
jgi:CheY-like chemotaxis protein